MMTKDNMSSKCISLTAIDKMQYSKGHMFAFNSRNEKSNV